MTETVRYLRDSALVTDASSLATGDSPFGSPELHCTSAFPGLVGCQPTGPDERAHSGRRSEGDGVGNISERANGTNANEAPKASLREVFGPKAAVGEKIFVGLLQHGVSEPAVPLSPRRD